MNLMPDGQQFKYKREPKIVIGTEPRFSLKESTLLKTHKAAFFGRASPGPAAVGDEFGPKFDITKARMGNAMPFAHKTKLVWPGVYNNPPEVGPGTFDRKDSAIGPQHLSKRRNQSTYAFARGPKFNRASSSDDVISKYDAARSCFGKQVLHKNSSAPSAEAALPELFMPPPPNLLDLRAQELSRPRTKSGLWSRLKDWFRWWPLRSN
eukprot:g1862.t1